MTARAILDADLQPILVIVDRCYAQDLAKKKEFLDALEKGEFGKVIHELFNKEKLIEYLSFSGIHIGKKFNKDQVDDKLSATALQTFEANIFNVINEYDANEEEVDNLMGDFRNKYSIEDDSDDYNYVRKQYEKHEKDHMDLAVRNGAHIVTDREGDMDARFSCTINGEKFAHYVTTELVQVVYADNDTASFILNY